MNVFPFRKGKQTPGNYFKPLWQEDFILGRNPQIDLRPAKDDFSQEIEMTRENEGLMAILKERAQEPATISLQEVKKRIEML
jgi:hypothetical protein